MDCSRIELSKRVNLVLLLVFAVSMVVNTVAFGLAEDFDPLMDVFSAFVMSLLIVVYVKAVLKVLVLVWSPFMNCLYSSVGDDESVVHSIDTEIAEDMV